MSRAATLAGYGVLAAAVVGYQLAGLIWRSTPTLGQALTDITHRRAARYVLLAGWLWLGWHVFVRRGIR